MFVRLMILMVVYVCFLVINNIFVVFFCYLFICYKILGFLSVCDVSVMLFENWNLCY